MHESGCNHHSPSSTAVSMAAVDIVRQYVGRIPAGLVYAAVECLVVLLLFLDALISFVAGEIARLFGLNLPCHLCTRLDRAIGVRYTKSAYKDLVCDSHALELSSLAYCHLHRRLAHVNRMCNGCLISFAAGVENAPNVDNEKLHRPSEDGGGCSCCGEAMPAKLTYLPTLFKMMSNARNVNAAETLNSALVFNGEEPDKLTSETESEEDDDWSSTMGTLEDDEGLEAVRPTVQVGAPESCVKDSLNSPATFGGAGGLARLAIGNGLNKIRATSESFDYQNDCKSMFAWGMNIWEANYKPPSNYGSPGVLSATASPRLSMLLRRLDMERPLTSSFKRSNKYNVDGTTSTNYNMASTADSLSTSSGSTTDEYSGDSLVQQLKQQVRLDRKSLIELCGELEKERSASAVAVNEAMAMINRLQEEKAGVQMEALQYQRLMEEQAEYDQEALQELRTQLARRDDEIRALQSEVEEYREKFPGEVAVKLAGW